MLMDGDNKTVLELRDLVHAFDGRPVLDVVHWTVGRGEHCLIQGPSGSGKSTLLHLIGGLMRANHGKLMVEGQALDELPARALDRLRGQKIGIVLQNFHLIEALDVASNLRLAQSLGGAMPDEERIETLLQSLGLAHLARRKPKALSHGERQRVAIVRAVINRPVLLLADEPTSALDDANASAVLHLLVDQADTAGATLLMASHDSRAMAHLPVGLQLGDVS